MRIVVDGLGAAPGSSAAVILEHFVDGWASLGSDELVVSLSPEVAALVSWPSSVVTVDQQHYRGPAGRVLAHNRAVSGLCREVRADAMVGLLPTTAMVPLPCPRVILSFDLRYELLPHQFSRKTKVLRTVAYSVGFRQADAIACISDRTRQDLLRSRPWLRRRLVGVAYLGADHVASWPVDRDAASYAVAFGQYGHKNVDLVIDAWALLRDRGTAMPIKLIGMPDGARPMAEAHIARLGLSDVVRPTGWLFGNDLRRCFASAGLFVFPSEFEGFGLPAVEAMQLGIPLVVSPDPALLEVTDGKATVMKEWTAAALAEAVDAALSTTPDDLGAARARASEFTWQGMAASVRALAQEAIARRR